MKKYFLFIAFSFFVLAETVPDCPKAPEIRYGKHKCSNGSKINSECEYFCNEGYQIEDPCVKINICIEDGVGGSMWKLMVPNCVKIPNTTKPPTTANPTTKQATTANPTTKQATTANPTTKQVTTANPTTNMKTSVVTTTATSLQMEFIKVSGDPMSWPDAQSFCEFRHNGNLITHDVETKELRAKLKSNYGISSTFLGFHRVDIYWQSVAMPTVARVQLGDANLDYVWLGGYPKDNGNFMAVALFDNAQSGKLYNVDDATLFKEFICEKTVGSLGHRKVTSPKQIASTTVPETTKPITKAPHTTEATDLKTSRARTTRETTKKTSIFTTTTAPQINFYLVEGRGSNWRMAQYICETQYDGNLITHNVETKEQRAKLREQYQISNTFLGYRKVYNTWQSVAMASVNLKYAWLGGYPKENRDFMAVVLSDNRQLGKIYNVDDSKTFSDFICEKVVN